MLTTTVNVPLIVLVPVLVILMGALVLTARAADRAEVKRNKQLDVVRDRLRVAAFLLDKPKHGTRNPEMRLVQGRTYINHLINWLR